MDREQNKMAFILQSYNLNYGNISVIRSILFELVLGFDLYLFIYNYTG